MLIQELFEKPVDRPIEGVIKADDKSGLVTEVEEYVLTKEVVQHIGRFFDDYATSDRKNGVWISGFFGSGKSHLLKMLALLLENRQLDNGARVLDLFLEKPDIRDDSYLRADMVKAVAIPSQSILFNIDQKANTAKERADALIGVFLRVFNEHCGYYGNVPYLAQFERDLDRDGRLDSFKSEYESIAGKPWSRGRETAVLESSNIDAAFARVNEGKFVANIRASYAEQQHLAIDDFARLVSEYINRQGKNFRLNFFVDEVGQYIAGNRNLMVNLQTIAESLATHCKGRAWLFVTAQEELQDIIGEISKTQQQDFSKIQGRFDTHIKLTSKNVDEVIQKRLLAKTGPAKEELARLHAAQKNNFRTLFDFPDGATTWRNYTSEEEFIETYPFVNYQFGLFQDAMRELSNHGAFTGRHGSIGERSMLGVFQQVAKSIQQQPVGALPTFDRMYDGISNMLKTQVTSSIHTAENNLNNEFAIAVLKTLLLVKWVRGFRATERNLAVLFLERFAQDLPALHKRVEEALTLLERQSWITRNGDIHEYLTNEEKDIEKEIKETTVADSELAAELNQLFFNSAIRENKFRAPVTGQDFPFTRKLDDAINGAQHELAIHVVTPLHPNAGEEDENVKIIVHQASGRDELLVILPHDARFMHDLRLTVQTDKYIKHSRGTGQPDSHRGIVDTKAANNNQRRTLLQGRALELLGEARLFVAGSELSLDQLDPRTRIQNAFLVLVARTYPHLAMLRGARWRAEDLRALLNPANNLYGADASTFSEAEGEVLIAVTMNHNNALRTRMQDVVYKFERKPYGWPLTAIQAQVAKLLGRGKLEARQEASLIEGQALERALLNTHGYGNLILEPITEIGADAVARLRRFHTEFFSRPPAASEAKAMAQETRAGLEELYSEANGWMNRRSDFAFLAAALEPALVTLRSAIEKPWDAWFGELATLEEGLLEAKEETLDPLREFMRPEKQAIYREIGEFLRSEEPNFHFAATREAGDLRTLYDAADIYRGAKVKRAKEALDGTRSLLNSAIAGERNRALNEMQERWTAFRESADIGALSGEQQGELQRRAQEAFARVEAARLISDIRYSAGVFVEGTLAEMRRQVYAWLNPPVESVGDVPAPGVVLRESVPLRGLHVSFSKPWLEDDAEVEAYVAALRAAILAEIGRGKRVAL